MKEGQADWTAWVLQFCLGALAGAVVTYALCCRLGILIGQWPYLFGVVAGGALLVGGAAAYPWKPLLARTQCLPRRAVSWSSERKIPRSGLPGGHRGVGP